MIVLLFSVALSLSAVAAWYAIVGLMAIFSASAIPILVMGSLLEASKLVVASWLYRNWREIPKLFKIYFVIALTTLMILTSMGIFGFLSKAHLDQAVPTGDISAKLALIDEKIKTEKEIIDANRKTIAQLDRQVDETLNRTATQDNNAGVNRSITIRRSQQAERKRALDDIGSAQARIAKLNEERAPIASEVRKVEAEVGPIKYIAELIYGEEAKNEGFLEKAVRIVIIMIVAVFDPLAVLMLMAANWQLAFNQRKPTIEEPKQEVTEEEDTGPKDLNLNLEDHIVTKESVVQTELDTTQNDSIMEEVIEDIVNEEPIELEIEHEEIEPTGSKTKLLGRYEEEIKKRPNRTNSFLNKVHDVFGVKTIEKEVEELQKDK